jgi:membrane-bound metal-dependent hydrolase YbcI (DUF457 family)
MASWRGHLSLSATLGVGYGAALFSQGVDPATCVLAAGVTALGGLMPDLDSDSGKPVRELFSIAAIVVPMLFLRRMIRWGLSAEEVLLIVGLLYVFIRFVVSAAFNKLTVHRGMFHSIPAMFIAGCVPFLAYHHPSLGVRAVLGLGVMIGFLSHLILDELCSVDFSGLTLRLNKMAGSALKFTSPSQTATATCYALLLLCLYGVYVQLEQAGILHPNAITQDLHIPMREGPAPPTPRSRAVPPQAVDLPPTPKPAESDWGVDRPAAARGY